MNLFSGTLAPVAGPLGGGRRLFPSPEGGGELKTVALTAPAKELRQV